MNDGGKTTQNTPSPLTGGGRGERPALDPGPLSPAEGHTLVQVRALTKHFPITGGPAGVRTIGHVRAVDGVSFDIAAGETLALVGESGCGKSTTGRMLLRLTEPTSGRIGFAGEDLLGLGHRALRRRRREIQIVFQDPYASLSPRQTVEDIVAESLDVYRLYADPKRRRERVMQLLRMVGLESAHVDRYPFEFSGGQRQRIAIARALAPEPRLIVADEPVSALDVSIRAQVVNLLQDLQERLGVAYLFISHDLAVVRHIAHRIAVMYLGRLVEIAERDSLFDAPHHPYTQALLSAVPVPDPERKRTRIILRGDVPSPACMPAGCNFHPRCPIAQDVCREAAPVLRPMADGRSVACHFAKPSPIAA
jgi:oligopeptide transport system ATP-binding protein